jgi:hydrogenase-1 operon protein HyaF
MTEDELREIHLLKGLKDPSQGENAYALLHEVVNLLQQLLSRDEPSHIDLRAIPFSRLDMALLAETLGEGGVYAEVADFGVTRVRQTGIPGVWWVVHLDDEEQIIGEFLEVNYCPEVLITPTEDIRDGREALQARLFEVEMARKRGS